MGQEENMNRVLLHSIGVTNFDSDVGKAAFDEILMLTREADGAVLGQNFDTKLDK